MRLTEEVGVSFAFQKVGQWLNFYRLGNLSYGYMIDRQPTCRIQTVSLLYPQYSFAPPVNRSIKSTVDNSPTSDLFRLIGENRHA
jgi:hypothetical protein